MVTEEVDGSPVRSFDDIWIAAFLLSRGHPLARVTRSGRLGVFWFTDEEGASTLDADVLAYHRGQDTVSARAFSGAVRRLKGMVAEGGTR